MTLETLDFALRHAFVGYSDELQALVEALRRRDVRVLNVYGEPGVGKTAISSRILDLLSSGRLADRFEMYTKLSAHMEVWSKVLSLFGEAVLEPSAVLRATQDEIAERVLAVCDQRQILAVIDNLERDDFGEALPFIAQWLRTSEGSSLLITSQNPLPALEHEEGLTRIRLTGLTDELACLVLLGPVLQERFGRNQLIECSRELRGVPLKLLYLRWMEPQDEAGLKDHVSQLKGEYEPDWLLESVLHSFPRSLAFFEALGAVRQLEFPEGLLAYFWDRLGAGNVATYVRIREELINARLLIPVGGTRQLTYRISAVIHMQLGKILARRVQEKRLPVVHFLASEYFRELLEDPTTSSLAALDSYVYHSFEAGRRRPAFTYVFDEEVITRVRQTGTAFHLRDILVRFYDALDEWTPTQQCRIIAEMAHVTNDLGEYEESLKLCAHAEDLLRGLVNGSDLIPRVRLQLRLWYLSAVAFSNTDRTTDCARSYAKVIAAAATTFREEPLACLSLGYLAHDLKHRDLERAYEYGVTAVNIGLEVGDMSVLAKNLGSLGEICVYAGTRLGDRSRFEIADASFRQARDLCSKLNDQRELGRTLKNHGVLALAERDWQNAETRLIEARGLSLSVGDVRRVATADLFLSILFRLRDDGLRDIDRSTNLILDSIAALSDVRDGRYLVPALLTYALWEDDSFSGILDEVPSSAKPGVAAEVVAGLMANPDNQRDLEAFAMFWREHFRPALLV